MYWRLINPNEKERFDSFVSSCETGDIMQSYAWGDIKNDWRALRGVVEDNQGNILASAAMLLRRLPFPLSKRTVAYVPRGPVLADYNNKELLAFTLNSLTSQAQRERAILVKIDPVLENNTAGAPSILQKLGFIKAATDGKFGGLQPRYTFRLSLEGSIEDIFSRFAKKVRYKIKYAQKRGLVFKSNEETTIEDFSHVLATTGSRSSFVTRSPDYFHHLYSILKKEDRILLLTGYIAVEPVVSSMTLVFGQTAWAVYGGQGESHRNLYTYHAMNWERIKWAHSRGAKWFDFYGVPGQADASHPLWGLYHFKQSFGGEFVAYIGEWDLPLSPPLYLLWEKGLPAYRQTIHKVLKLFRR